LNVLVILIPVSLLLGGLGLAAFLWTIRSDQYDDAKGNAARILMEDEIWNFLKNYFCFSMRTFLYLVETPLERSRQNGSQNGVAHEFDLVCNEYMFPPEGFNSELR